jgi:hypothetical protein
MMRHNIKTFKNVRYEVSWYNPKFGCNDIKSMSNYDKAVVLFQQKKLERRRHVSLEKIVSVLSKEFITP